MDHILDLSASFQVCGTTASTGGSDNGDTSLGRWQPVQQNATISTRQPNKTWEDDDDDDHFASYVEADQEKDEAAVGDE